MDAKKLAWDEQAVKALPSFKLGDASVTSQVLIKHLICACTGMPRQDLEWLLEFEGLTPEKAMAVLGTMQPTSRFGELFQYSNPMAAAAGFLGGHVAYPGLELGAAYDKAMQALVFDPLGMASTTHDFARARRGNVATPHAPDVDGKTALAEGRTNLSIVPVRPAGGAWSSVNDMVKYVAMELAEGKLPDGRTYISKEALFARRAPQVVVGTDITYGMGLTVNTQYGTPIVHHGGDMIGFHSDMMWLPEHGVGAVILTNGDPGWLIRTIFRRKLLEVLFDGHPEADGQMAASARTFFDEIAADRKLVTVPADALVCGDERAVYADKGYAKAARRQWLKGLGIKPRLMHKSWGGGPQLSVWQKRHNALIAAARAEVEGVFATLKRWLGLAQVRYRGLLKNDSHLQLVALAYNMKRALKLA